MNRFRGVRRVVREVRGLVDRSGRDGMDEKWRKGTIVCGLGARRRGLRQCVHRESMVEVGIE
jgi:hypothetical protein